MAEGVSQVRRGLIFGAEVDYSQTRVHSEGCPSGGKISRADKAAVLAEMGGLLAFACRHSCLEEEEEASSMRPGVEEAPTP